MDLCKLSGREQCPLCLESKCRLFSVAYERNYYRCENCNLIYLDPVQRPSATEEVERYRLHRYNYTDTTYLDYMQKMLAPLISRLSPGDSILDYGCGHESSLEIILSKEPFRVTSYDPFFFPDSLPSIGVFSAIACIEAAEHFHQPRTDLSRMIKMIAPRGLLLLRTQLVEERDFTSWHYPRDFTHVSFFSRETFAWLEKAFHLKLESIDAQGALFQLA